MSLSHVLLSCAEPWTLDAQREFARVIGNSAPKSVRISGSSLLKFARKAFTEPDGTAVIKWLDITGFRAFCFPAFVSRKARHGKWDLATPQMTHFDWRAYLGTYREGELQEMLEVPIHGVLVAYTKAGGAITNGDEHWSVLKSAPNAGKWFLVFLRIYEGAVVCSPDARFWVSK